MTPKERAAASATLLVTSIGAALVPFMGSAVIVALPTIGADLGAGAVTLGWVNTAFALAAAVCLLPMGRLADLVGRRRVFLWGAGLFAAGAACAAAAPTVGWLIAARAVQGVAGSMLFGTTAAILTSVFPPGERGRVLGINVGAVYAGLSVGPFVGGVLVQHAGWRSLFLLIVPVCLLIVWLMATRVRREWAEGAGEPFDLAGSLLYGVAMLALVYGGTRLPAPAGWGLVAAGLAGLAGFAAWEAAQAHPVLEVRVLAANRVFLFSNLAALASYSATAGSGFLLSLYLQSVKGMSPRAAGGILLIQAVMQALVAPFAGRLSDRVEPRFVASSGMALTAVGLLMLTPLDAGTGLPRVVAALVCLGIGFGLFSSPNTNAVMSSVERRHLGVAAATVGTMRLSGQMLSMGAVMAALAVFLGAEAVTPARAGEFLRAARTCYAAFAALSVVGVFASLARGTVR